MPWNQAEIDRLRLLYFNSNRANEPEAPTRYWGIEKNHHIGHRWPKE